MARKAGLTIILAAMWAAFTVLLAIVSPAAAHSGHHHGAGPVLEIGPTNISEGVAGLSQEDPAPTQRKADGLERTTWMSVAAAQPHEGCPEGSCSCGCVQCHGGFLTAQSTPEFLGEGQEKFELRVGVVLARNLPDAIERPPRATLPV
jgi:hypothetical protein